jgi:hypothetical protein
MPVNREHHRETFLKSPLRELERLRPKLIHGLERAEEEVALLEAMIAGLMEHRPTRYAGKVEELRAQQEKLRPSIEATRLQVEVLNEVIVERQRKLG